MRIWITGASGGIGAAIARRLAEPGASLYLSGQNGQDRLQAIAASCRARGAAVETGLGDLRQSGTVACQYLRLRERYKGLDVLINTAGIALQKLLTETTDADWEQMLGTDLSAVFYTCRAVLPDMIRQKNGCIINVSSMWGMHGASCEAAYSAAKAGVIGLSQALAREVGPSGIRVNVLAPGMIRTPMNASFTPAELAAIQSETPLERLGQPEDVAEACAFLSSEAAAFITGAVLPVDGGFMA
ncbi:3-oxoacyl-ACP reductase FabG [Oscillospiraceae bacterium HV4-5-C5C]|nr:3-oxoacyl-ACP reductase FabG [Oscillospiraceae bacterium HV4-5-C5C]